MLQALRRLALGAAFLLAPIGFAHTAAAQTAPAEACAALKKPGLFPNTTVRYAVFMAPRAGETLPPYCEIYGVVRPVKGSNIGVMFRLPENWNGKMLGLGGGGSAGNIRLDTATPGLKAGYAIAQSDGGHEDTDQGHNDWAVVSPGVVNKITVEDFGNRAIHQMTLVGKQVVARYYGHAQAKAYFQGCSTGGRMGMMEIQRYPDDYDAVITGAPVYTLKVNTTGLIRAQFFRKTLASTLTPDQVPLLVGAVTRACDMLDGIKDGIIGDPRQCHWDPAEIVCKAGEKAGPKCLSAAQAEAVRSMYRGQKTSKGEEVAYPILHGSEGNWVDRLIGTRDSPLGYNYATSTHTVTHIVLGQPDFDFMTFKPDQLGAVEGSWSAGVYEAKNPDISRFLAHGGKWLVWHGLNDPGPNPLYTAAYFDDAKKVSGQKLGKSAAQLDQQMRLFLAPGVYHCGGGPGADRFDLLAALDTWVKTDKPPQTLLATNRAGTMHRPLCPWPGLPRYKGEGDPNAAENFTCRP